MELYRVKSVTDGLYDGFLSIYSMSFPPFEQRNGNQHIYALSNEKYHLDCYVEGDNILAFIVWWDFDNYIYIEHFAVNALCRGMNIGTRVLSGFIENTDKLVLLEIDPLTDDISRKRYEFYKRLGFVSNPYDHYHPAYDNEYKPHKLIVLSSGREIAGDEYTIFYNDLKDIVMKV